MSFLTYVLIMKNTDKGNNMLLNTALLCLAANIYFESRGENIAGQYAVAQVTMNRANNDSRKICAVVLAPKQFSWTGKCVSRVTKRARECGRPGDQVAYERAAIIARQVLKRRIYDFTDGSRFYHTAAVRPVWRKQMVFTKAIGRHIFYKLA